MSREVPQSADVTSESRQQETSASQSDTPEVARNNVSLESRLEAGYLFSVG